MALHLFCTGRLGTQLEKSLLNDARYGDVG
jgi:hypothetical protein